MKTSNFYFFRGSIPPESPKILEERPTTRSRRNCRVIFHSTNERSHWIKDNISSPNLNNSILLKIVSFCYFYCWNNRWNICQSRALLVLSRFYLRIPTRFQSGHEHPNFEEQFSQANEQRNIFLLNYRKICRKINKPINLDIQANAKLQSWWIAQEIKNKIT